MVGTSPSVTSTQRGIRIDSEAPASVTNTTTNNAPGNCEQRGEHVLHAGGDAAADDRAADQAEHRQPRVDPHQVDAWAA